jgi:hypothetical protein
MVQAECKALMEGGTRQQGARRYGERVSEQRNLSESAAYSVR